MLVDSCWGRFNAYLHTCDDASAHGFALQFRARAKSPRVLQGNLKSPKDKSAKAFNADFRHACVCRSVFHRRPSNFGGNALETSAGTGASKFSGHEVSVAFELFGAAAAGVVPDSESATLEKAILMCALALEPLIEHWGRHAYK